MDAYDLTRKAAEGGAIRELLLGEGGFAFIPKFSPSDLATDLAVVLPDGVYPYAERNPQFPMRERMDDTLRKFTGTALEITSFALVVFFESQRRYQGKSHLGLDLDSLSGVLKGAIDRQRHELEREQSFGGRGYPDGVVGNLRRLSGMTETSGGPSFFPEK